MENRCVYTSGKAEEKTTAMYMNHEEAQNLINTILDEIGTGYAISYTEVPHKPGMFWCSISHDLFCIATFNNATQWETFKQAARSVVAKEQEKEQEKALEKQAGELGFGNDLEWTESQASQDFFQSPDWDGRVPGMPEEEEFDPFLDGPDLNETVHPVVDSTEVYGQFGIPDMSLQDYEWNKNLK